MQGLSPSLIAGTAIAATAALVLAIVLIFVFVKRHKNEVTDEEKASGMPRTHRDISFP